MAKEDTGVRQRNFDGFLKVVEADPPYSHGERDRGNACGRFFNTL